MNISNPKDLALAASILAASSPPLSSMADASDSPRCSDYLSINHGALMLPLPLHLVQAPPSHLALVSGQFYVVLRRGAWDPALPDLENVPSSMHGPLKEGWKIRRRWQGTSGPDLWKEARTGAINEVACDLLELRMGKDHLQFVAAMLPAERDFSSTPNRNPAHEFPKE